MLAAGGHYRQFAAFLLAETPVSWLLVEPAMLGGRALEFLRFPSLLKTDRERFFSSLMERARAEDGVATACSCFVSMKSLGKIPVLPLGFVPVQHQLSALTSSTKTCQQIFVHVLRSGILPLTRYIGNHIALVELEPVHRVLVFILFLDRKLPPGLCLKQTAPIVPNHIAWGRIESNEFKGDGCLHSVMPCETPITEILLRPGNTSDSRVMSQLKSRGPIVEQHLAVDTSSLVL